MAFSTKQNLSNQKFKQVSGSTLNLSGDTIIANSGSLNYQSAISISEPTEIVHKQYVDDSISNVTSLIITGATNGLTKTGKRVKLGGTLTGNTEIAGGGYYLNFGSASSKLSTLSVTTTSNQNFRSDTITVDDTVSPFNFIVDTGTASAGRNIATFVKRNSGGTPDVNNVGIIKFVSPTSTLVEKPAIELLWRFSTATNGNESSALDIRGYYTGSSNNLIFRILPSAYFIGHGTSAIGGFDIAIGQEARAWNGGQIALGYRAGKTSGSATGRHHSISIGYNANQGTKPIGTYSIAIGSAAQSISADTISIGRSAGNTTGVVGINSISIGALSNQGSSNIGQNSVAIGVSSKSIGTNSIAIGNNANSDGGVSIGSTSASEGDGISIGIGAKTRSTNAISLGTNAGVTTGSFGAESIILGKNAGGGAVNANIGATTIIIGSNSVATSSNGISIGTNISTTATGAITIGNNCNNNTTNSVQFGWNSNDDLKLIKGTLQTTNNTTTTLLAYTLQTGSTYSIKATIKAREVSGADRALYVKQGLFYREGGGAVQQGTTQDVISDIESNSAWDSTFDVSGNDVRVRVTGAASTTINWHVILEVQRVS